MSWYFSGFLLCLFGLSLILITLALRFLPRTNGADESYRKPAQFFLIVLRLAIGWHCFIEGMEKLSTPNWTSETYLRESTGPFSGVYRWVAGDRLIDKATLGEDDAFPAELEREWREYLKAFAKHYDLDNDQLKRAEGILEQRMSDTKTYLLSKPEPVIKIAQYPPELPLDMTMKQRLAEHDRLLGLVQAAEAQFPTTDPDAHADWKRAKADLAKWRADIKKIIDAQTDKLKKIDDGLKTKLVKSIESLSTRKQNTTDPKALAKLEEELKAEQAKLWAPLADVLTSDQKLKGAMPDKLSLPILSWRLLEWSDFLVKWGLLVLGGCLMLGLCSRASCAAAALLILSFYLAMPPLPGWPESPRLEGHYLLINKTLIEIFALAALAFIPTGRWAGLDGLFCLCCTRKSSESAA